MLKTGTLCGTGWLAVPSAATLALAVALPLVGTPAIAAQTPLEPGPELERLGVFVGDWRGEITETFADGRVDRLTSQVSYSWQMGDVWLQEDVTGDTPIGVVYNRALITFVPRLAAYSGFWIDTIGGIPIRFDLEWRDEDTLEFDTGTFDYFGLPMRFRLRYIVDSDDQYRMRQWSWRGGELVSEAEGLFTRAG